MNAPRDEPTKTLGRIRALLTQAEDPAATPEEAEAFTAKAAELMAKYGVDRAMLAATDPTSDVPCDRIVAIVGQYALDKQGLLSAVAHAVECRTVLRTRWIDGRNERQVHLFGYGSDLERAEMLYTSLLVQATNGIAHTPVPHGQHKAAFRRSWLEGFRWAIVERLRAAEKRAQDEAERNRPTSSGPSVALVLADRATVVQARLTAAHPRLGKSAPRKLSGGGLRHGYRAGQHADIGDKRASARAHIAPSTRPTATRSRRTTASGMGRPCHAYRHHQSGITAGSRSLQRPGRCPAARAGALRPWMPPWRWGEGSP